MSDRIEKAIRAEAAKLIRRHQRYAADLADRARREERRSGVPAAWTVKIPEYWALDSGFDPYHVRSHAASIAYAVRKALRSDDYTPRPPVVYEVAKPGGGTRRVNVFHVADNAISRLVFKSLTRKNAARLSSRCYAYRSDLSVHDAVDYISAEFRSASRLFVAEYDFSAYFDSILHTHIRDILHSRRFFVTKTEERVLWAFLRAAPWDIERYSRQPPPNRSRGIPQGTSVSLFLANAAAAPLDSRLEKLGVGFARYADDTLIWSNDYAQICDAVDAMATAAKDMGVEVNLQKSEGISILASKGAQVEFRPKYEVAFIGYGLTHTRIRIKESTVRRIKSRMSYLIQSNLLRNPSRGRIVASRFAPFVDRDYLVLIMQLRRYLYGGLGEGQLRRFLAGGSPRIHFRGLMSFYPIVDDEKQLGELDGWLLHTIWTSLRKRERILKRAGYPPLPTPHGLSKRNLLTFHARTTKGHKLDARVPSFARMSRMLRRASQVYGSSQVAHPRSGQYTPWGLINY